MSNKKDLIDTVMQIVLECCHVEMEGVHRVTAEDVYGKSREESIVMTRCIFVTHMAFCGFSRTTIAAILHRSEKTIGHILEQAHRFRIASPAYRFAEAESTIMLRNEISKY